MTILIENADTLEYLAKDGRWSKKVTDALTYRTSTLAREHGVTVPVARFNVVGVFKNSPQMVNLDEGVGAGSK